MMTVDASALRAIILEEEDAGSFRRVIASADSAVISAVNYWEVLVRAQVEFGPAGLDFAEALLVESRIRVESADVELARSAAAAFERFRGRPGGRLNLGDCFAYALADREGDGLLFKGGDLPKTRREASLGLTREGPPAPGIVWSLCRVAFGAQPRCARLHSKEPRLWRLACAAEGRGRSNSPAWPDCDGDLTQSAPPSLEQRAKAST